MIDEVISIFFYFTLKRWISTFIFQLSARERFILFDDCQLTGLKSHGTIWKKQIREYSTCFQRDVFIFQIVLQNSLMEEEMDCKSIRLNGREHSVDDFLHGCVFRLALYIGSVTTFPPSRTTTKTSDPTSVSSLSLFRREKESSKEQRNENCSSLG